MLGALLPFELRKPLLTVGAIGITNVELVLYVALALWTASGGVRRVAWTPFHVAVVAWALAHVLSAALAANGRAEALRFALRASAGAALAFAVADLIRAERGARRLLAALAAGAVVSALAALAEVWVAGAAQSLQAFKTVTASAGALVRAGGTFQYPNIAALYWSAALPLALALRVKRGDAVRMPWLGPAAGVVLALAVVASASRGGLVVVVLVLAALVVLGRRSGLRGPALIVLLGMGAALGVDAVSHPLVAGRWRAGFDTPWYRGRFVASTVMLQLEAGEVATVPLEARNDGVLTWRASGAHAMGVVCEWHRAEGGVVGSGSVRALPSDVGPGEAAQLAIDVQAPAAAGRYALRWRLASDGAVWSDPETAKSGEIVVTVTGAPQVRPTPPSAPRPVQGQPTRLELWRAGLRMWRDHPVFGVGPDNFRRLYSGYLGPRRLDERVAANSLYVETLAELGLVGLVVLASLIASLASALRVAWRAPAPRDLVLVTAAGLAAFFAHGLVDHVLPFTPAYGLFWMLAGLIAAGGLGERDATP